QNWNSDSRNEDLSLEVEPDILPFPAGMRPESPTLSSVARTAKAYELKVLVSERQAELLAARLCEHLALDPYADPTLGNAYRVISVYYDTANFDVYHRGEGHRRHKYRLR